MISEFVEYVKQAWKNKPNVSSPLNADRLNHMEDGIENNSKKIKEIVPAVNELTEKLAAYYITLDNISINQISTSGMHYKEYPLFFQEFETIISTSIANFSNSSGLFNICQSGNALILMSDTEVTISGVIIKVIGKKY